MSQVNADTIRKSDGSLGTDIRIKNTSVYESDGGTSVTQNLVQGISKVWVQFNGQASGAASRDSLNVGSMTDNGTGNYNVNFSNNMSNDDYASAGIGNTASITSETVASHTIQVLSANASGSLSDVTLMATSILGDLA